MLLECRWGWISPHLLDQTKTLCIDIGMEAYFLMICEHDENLNWSDLLLQMNNKSKQNIGSKMTVQMYGQKIWAAATGCIYLVQRRKNMNDFMWISWYSKYLSGKCWFLTSLTTAVLLGLFLAGYNYYWKDVISIRVMSYNTWGMPSMLSLDKEERMKR